jgi:hypothetical protein
MAPRLLTPGLVGRVAEVVQVGVRKRDAAMALGISERTYRHWLSLGHRERARMEALGLSEPDDDAAVYVAFLDACDNAWAEAKATALLSIRHAMTTDWRAAAWWLERVHRLEFGRARADLPYMPGADDLDDVDPDDMAEAMALAAEEYLAEVQRRGES